MRRSRTSIHVDEMGNVRKGPPLPMPMVLDGAYAQASRSSFMNEVGSESMIPPPISGRQTLGRLRPDELDHILSRAEPVENGLHHGHVMNDPNNELDAGELAGINQAPLQPLLNMAYDYYRQPIGGQSDSLFTTQARPPPGIMLPAARLTRAPGGGVAAPAAVLGAGPNQSSHLGGSRRPRTVFDVAAQKRNEDARASAMLRASGGLTGDGGGSSGVVRRAAKLAAVDSAFTPSEIQSRQAQTVLNAQHHREIREHGKRFPVHREYSHHNPGERRRFSYYIDKYGRRRRRYHRPRGGESYYYGGGGGGGRHRGGGKCMECRRNPNNMQCMGCHA